MKTPHPFPYQGSKRRLAAEIVRCIPADARLFEPFVGSGAVSLFALRTAKVRHVVLSDANAPLMRLWEALMHDPEGLADEYEKLWHAQTGRERDFYDEVRAAFNEQQMPPHLLFLLMRCVKAAVRYNAQGEFNQSPDNRRRGTAPAIVRRQLMRTSRLLAGRATLLAGDFEDVLEQASPADVVYLDPPYEGVSAHRDRRYVAVLARERFVAVVEKLRRRSIAVIISYDGRMGQKRYGSSLPSALGLERIELAAGRSSQATLLGREAMTYESLYISSELTARIEPKHDGKGQFSMFADEECPASLSLQSSENVSPASRTAALAS